MILLDANVLVYLYSSTSPFHEQAREWFEDAMAAREDIGLSFSTISAFLRVITHRGIRTRPAEMSFAVEVVDELLSHSNVHLLTESPAHWSLLKGLLKEGQVTGNLVTDARVAAIAIEHGATLCTNDKDFTRFNGLRLLNPFTRQ